MDELSTLGLNEVCQIAKMAVLSEMKVDPKALGFGKAKLEELVGGDAAENAAILEGVLAGTIKGAKHDIAVLNAAAGFVITGMAADLPAGKAGGGTPQSRSGACEDAGNAGSVLRPFSCETARREMLRWRASHPTASMPNPVKCSRPSRRCPPACGPPSASWASSLSPPDWLFHVAW
jgi:hypothetical protein